MITEHGYSSDYLESLQNETAAPAPEVPAWQRALAYGVALPTNLISNIGQSVGNLVGLPTGPMSEAQMIAPQTGMQTLTDVAGHLAPVAAELALTGRTMSPVLESLGLARSPVALNTVRDAAQFGLLGAQEDRTVGAEQAAEGAGIGLSSALPRKYRLPLAALMALGSKSFFDQHGAPGESNVIGTAMGHDWTRGDVSGLALAGAAMLPGRAAWRRPILPDPVMPEWQGPRMPRFQEGNGVEGPLQDWSPGSRSLVPSGAQPVYPRDVTQPWRGEPFTADRLGTYYAGMPEAWSRGPVPELPSPPQNPLLAMAGADRPFSYGLDFGEGVPQTERQLRNRTPFRKEVVPLEGSMTPRLSAEPINPYAMVPVSKGPTLRGGAEISKLFDPADAQWLKENLNADIDNPEIQNAMLRLKMGVSQAMVRSDHREARLAFARFFEEIGHRPDVNAFSPEQGEAAWQQIERMGQASQLRNAPLVSNPLPEGDPLGLGMTPSKPSIPVAEIQSRANNLPAQQAARDAAELSRAEALSEAQREAARRGKIPDLPEYRRTQGGFIDPEVLQSVGLAGARAVAGGLIGGVMPAVDSDDRMMHAALGAGLFAGLPYAPKLIELIQKMKLGDKLNTEATGPRYRSTVSPDMGPGMRGRPVSDESLQSMQTAFDGREDARVEAQRAAARRGRINPIPEYRRTEGGGVINPFSDRGGLPRSMEGGVADPFPKSGEGMKGGTLPPEGAFIMPELSAAGARAVMGGLVGGTIGAFNDDPTTHSGFVIGASIGALAGVIGPSVSRSLLKVLGGAKVSLPRPNEGWTSFIRNWNTRLEEAAGATFNGSQRTGDRFLRFLDSGFDLTMPTAVKNVLLQAKGAGSVLLDQIDSAILNVSLRYEPDAIVKEITNKYLDGKLGTGQAGMDAYMREMQPHVAANRENMSYAKFAVAGRTAVDGLQRMLAAGIGDAKLRNIVTNSIGGYLTRSYKLFADRRYIPSDESVDRLAKYLAGVETTKDGNTVPLMGTTEIGAIKRGLYQYIREVKATKGNYVASSPVGQSIDQGLLKERVKIIDPKTGEQAIDAVSGEPITQMREEWRQFFGEITNPTERIYQTVFRLRPMAESSKFFHDIASVEVDGVPQVFENDAAVDAFRNQLLQSMQSAAPDARGAIEHRLSQLNQYQYVEAQAKYGDLQGRLVSRHVWDTLKTYDSLTDVSSGWMRSIANAHTAIKLTRTALSPITVLRNIFTAPMFLAIGRGSLTDVAEAYRILKDPAHPLRKEILERGIGNVDQVKTEFHKEFDNLTGAKYNFGQLDMANLGLGKLDLDLAERVGRRGFREVLDFYRLPDNLVRISTYLSARRRIAEELGLAIDHSDVLDRAVNFTNRYTMNYDALPPRIKQLRQVPFVNLFLSYSAEMGRIGKNLVEDAIKGGNGFDSHGRMYAMTMLSTLAVLPELLQSSSVASLSPKDREEWNRIQAMSPDYARTRYKFGITKDPKTGMFHYYDFTPLIATDSYNQMTRAIVSRDWKALATVNPFIGTQNTPALNIASMVVSGRDMQGREFRKIGLGGGTDLSAAVAREVTPPLPIFPWTNEGEKWTLAYSKDSKGELGLTNSRTGVRLTPGDVWFPYFSGIRPASVSGAALFHQFQAQAKQDVANEIAYANRMLKMNLPAEKSNAIIQRTKAAISTIQARYMEQAGLNVSHTSSANSGGAL